ncbi:hypothetical protein LIER_36470 [Lithospermum erythrorhizon]|uniref:F-box protein n=1 Tax=Lithospermum erythrorhizon TaxID=34254 RepID=A0AAV3P688_LITER
MANEGSIGEALVCIPANLLMRFKCASKLWYSIIRNPKFAIAHSNGEGCFSGLLITDIYYDTSFRTQRFFYASVDHNCSRLMQHHFTIAEPKYTNVTEVS